MPNAVPRVCGAHLECHHTLRHQPNRISQPYDQRGARLAATCRRTGHHSAPTVAVSVVVHARGSDATEGDGGCQMRYHGCVERTSSATTRSATSRIESHNPTTNVVRDSRPRAAAQATIRLPRWP